MKRYWAIRPKSAETDEAIRKQYTRMAKADTAFQAYNEAFGRGGSGSGYQYKDLGTRIQPLQVNKTRLKLLLEPKGWVNFK